VFLISLHEMSPVEGLSNLETQKVGKNFGPFRAPGKIGGRVVLTLEITRPKASGFLTPVSA
jgi:hypothetical protein